MESPVKKSLGLDLYLYKKFIRALTTDAIKILPHNLNIFYIFTKKKKKFNYSIKNIFTSFLRKIFLSCLHTLPHHRLAKSFAFVVITATYWFHLLLNCLEPNLLLKKQQYFWKLAKQTKLCRSHLCSFRKCIRYFLIV